MDKHLRSAVGLRLAIPAPTMHTQVNAGSPEAGSTSMGRATRTSMGSDAGRLAVVRYRKSRLKHQLAKKASAPLSIGVTPPLLLAPVLNQCVTRG